MEPFVVSNLGPDAQRQHRINSNSFQQSAILSHRGWQYVCCYFSPSENPSQHGNLRVSLCRRICHNATPKWEVFTFQDYEQDVDDGHNTISIGICPGDGTIHMSWDLHCDR